jgi:hypothetical protein
MGLGSFIKSHVHKLGQAVTTGRQRLGKAVNHPAIKVAATVGVAVAGTIAKVKLDEANMSRKQRHNQDRIMQKHRLEEHQHQMSTLDPRGQKQKALDQFVATKPFEDAFNFDEPF